MTNDIGTLADLGVKVGDVVELVSWCDGDTRNVGEKYTILEKHPKWCISGMVAYSNSGYFLVHGNHSGYVITFRIISRASEEPKTWGQMTDEEKGALLLAKHEGKVIECLFEGHSNWDVVAPTFYANHAYRIKPEPVVETVVITNFHESARGYHIKFEVKDGEPDVTTIAMEKL